MTTNCIKFINGNIETAKGSGSISTLSFGLDITVEPITSGNPLAPTHRVLGRSPRGKLVECGGIWKKQNKDTGADYFTLTIRDFSFNANLGKAANQVTAQHVLRVLCLNSGIQPRRRSAIN